MKYYHFETREEANDCVASYGNTTCIGKYIWNGFIRHCAFCEGFVVTETLTQDYRCPYEDTGEENTEEYAEIELILALKAYKPVSQFHKSDGYCGRIDCISCTAGNLLSLLEKNS